jgi:LPXTG-motif cell wall-anchored protein
MTGQMVWAYRGAGTAVVGLVLLLFTLRRRKNP